MNNNTRSAIYTGQEENGADLWAQLPVEIVDQLLLHLPVKSLLRFRTVCKRWNAMISEPKFAIKHLRTSLASDGCYCTLVTRRNRGASEIGYASNQSIFGNPNNFEILFSPLFENEEVHMTHARVMASCNGLLLLQFGEYELYIWNPVTREMRKLRSIPWNMFNLKFMYPSAGFAYDEINADYKVAVFFLDGDYKGLCAIYSLRGDEWTLVDVPDRIDNDTNSTIVLHGTLHWLTCEDGNSCQYIVALDIVSGRIREIALPECAPNGVGAHRLWILEGCLCVVGLRNYDFWVMKDYGVVESWTFLFRVPCWRITHYDSRPELFLWGSSDRKLLIWLPPSWVVFDTKTQSITTGCPSPSNSIRPVLSFVESLVSPNRI